MFDPFTLLGVEKKYDLDIELLDKAYFAAQKNTHPDQFANASSAEKAEASQRSAALNQAYMLLKDPLRRAELLLQQANIAPLSDDPSFLEQLMEWREMLGAKENIKDDILATQTRLFQNLKQAFINEDYETARSTLYRLTYMSKLLKEKS